MLANRSYSGTGRRVAVCRKRALGSRAAPSHVCAALLPARMAQHRPGRHGPSRHSAYGAATERPSCKRAQLRPSPRAGPHLRAASSMLSPGCTFPPKPFHSPAPNPRFFMPRRTRGGCTTSTRVKSLEAAMALRRAGRLRAALGARQEGRGGAGRSGAPPHSPELLTHPPPRHRPPSLPLPPLSLHPLRIPPVPALPQTPQPPLPPAPGSSRASIAAAPPSAPPQRWAGGGGRHGVGPGAVRSGEPGAGLGPATGLPSLRPGSCGARPLVTGTSARGSGAELRLGVGEGRCSRPELPELRERWDTAVSHRGWAVQRGSFATRDGLWFHDLIASMSAAVLLPLKTI